MLSVDHGSNREPCGAVRPQTELCATPTVRFAPRTAPQRHGSVRGGGEPPRSTTVPRGSPRFAIFFRVIFSRGFHTPSYQVCFQSCSALSHNVLADSRIVAVCRLAPHSRSRCLSTIAFSLRLPLLCIAPRRHSPLFSCRIPFFQLTLLPSIRRTHFYSFRSLSAYDGPILSAFVLFPYSPRRPFSCSIVFWQLLLTHRIRQSRFGSFRSLYAFSLAARATRSRVRTFFGRFCPFPVFDGRILAALAHPRFLMVGFWQLLLSPRILKSSLTSYSRVRSNFDSFCSHTAFDARILAAFAFFPHSHFGNFCSLLLSHARHAPVLARDPIFAAFACTAFDGRILAASVHTLLSQWETPLIQCYIRLPTGLKLYQYFA